MPVVVYGEAGRSVGESGVGGRDGARRGAFFERVVGGACEEWLAGRTDVNHLFHDVSNLRDITGADLGRFSLGFSNIDHVVLSGEAWLMLDAKGCGAGVLSAVGGKGCLVQPDGAIVAQPWLDKVTSKSQARALYQLTDGKGARMFYVVFVVPDTVQLDLNALGHTRALTAPALICTVAALRQGFLDRAFPAGQPAADPADIAKLRARLSSPESVRTVM